jgi:hypothetical protein
MIPHAFLVAPALSCLFAARCAAAYWQASAELWAAFQSMTASADIVPFPLAPRSLPPAARAAGQRDAEIVRFVPIDR